MILEKNCSVKKIVDIILNFRDPSFREQWVNKQIQNEIDTNEEIVTKWLDLFEDKNKETGNNITKTKTEPLTQYT